MNRIGVGVGVVGSVVCKYRFLFIRRSPRESMQHACREASLVRHRADVLHERAEVLHRGAYLGLVGLNLT